MDDDMKKLLAGVVGVVEATNFEKSMIWAENRRREVPRRWEDNPSGRGAGVGYCAGEPVCISLLTAEIDGEKLLFWFPISEVVSHRRIRAWLETNLPKSAFRADGRLNQEDAQNWHAVLGRERLADAA